MTTTNIPQPMLSHSAKEGPEEAFYVFSIVPITTEAAIEALHQWVEENVTPGLTGEPFGVGMCDWRFSREWDPENGAI